MNIREEIHIEKDVEEVYAYLMDFKLWPEWSPWLICEPDCKLSYEGDSYSWDGKVVGSGEMTLTDSAENQRMEYDLKFFKPWKSQADVQLELSAKDGGTMLTWAMQSSLPWFLFFLKPMMVRMITMDYQRGLRMLKEKLETGSVDSKLEFTPSQQVEGCHYIGIERTCSMDEMDTCMEQDFSRLMELPLKNKLEEDSSNLSSLPFTIYHKWKLGKGLVSYTCAVPISGKLHNIAELPFETVSGYRPPCAAFVVTHTGAYQHLGNAWSAAMCRAQNKLIPQSKKIMPFEIYVTCPEHDGDLITKVCLPLRD